MGPLKVGEYMPIKVEGESLRESAEKLIRTARQGDRPKDNLWTLEFSLANGERTSVNMTERIIRILVMNYKDVDKATDQLVHIVATSPELKGVDHAEGCLEKG